MPTYQPNIPTGNVPLNQDYLNLQGNFQQLNITYGVDHIPYSDTSGTLPTGLTGAHKAIHLNPVSTTATNAPNNQPVNGYTATTGFGQIFGAQINDGINTDTALYALTAGNRLQQLTRNFVPVSSANGYTFLPGGLILQWGTKNIAGNTPAAFNVKTVNIFNIQTTLIGNSSSSNIVSVIASTPGSPGSFTWNFTGTSSYSQFFWMAVTN